MTATINLSAGMILIVTRIENVTMIENVAMTLVPNMMRDMALILIETTIATETFSK